VKRRGFARGEPPPPGSYEYAGTGCDPSARTTSGFTIYEVSFTDLDAAKNWVDAVDRSVRQSRRVHGDRYLSRGDESSWDAFLAEWRPFHGDMALPGHFNSMLKSNKRAFDDLRRRGLALHDEFASKGMSAVPVPYANDLLLLLRQTPKALTASEMQSRLLAGALCGERMLADQVDWVDRIRRGDHRGLREAIAGAKEAAEAFGHSRTSPVRYPSGSPAYDEFLRRLTRVWVEAAALAGVKATEATAKAELYQRLGEGGEKFPWYLAGLLAAAGVGYLGVKWIASESWRPSPRREPEEPVLSVRDAYREE